MVFLLVVCLHAILHKSSVLPVRQRNLCIFKQQFVLPFHFIELQVLTNFDTPRKLEILSQIDTWYFIDVQYSFTDSKGYIK